MFIDWYVPFQHAWVTAMIRGFGQWGQSALSWVPRALSIEETTYKSCVFISTHILVMHLYWIALDDNTYIRSNNHIAMRPKTLWNITCSDNMNHHVDFQVSGTSKFLNAEEANIAWSNSIKGKEKILLDFQEEHVRHAYRTGGTLVFFFKLVCDWDRP